MSRALFLRPPSQRGTSVIVPLAEGPSRLDELYREFSPAVAGHDEDFEFIFVVEAWRREMVDALQPLIDSGEPIRIVQIEHTAAEATLIEAGAAHAAHPVLAILPSYPRVTPEGLGRLLAVLRDERVDLVTAERYPRRDPLWNRIQGRLLRTLLRHTVWVRFRDIASGVRVLRREVLEDVPLYAEYARFLPVLAIRAGYRVREVAVPQHISDQTVRFRGPGTYLRRIVDLVGLAFLVRFTRKPLRFFGLIGTGLAALGGAALLVIAVQRMNGQSLADHPLLLLGVLFIVLGAQSIGLGLVGELVVHFQATRTRGYRIAQDVPGAKGTASSDEMDTPENRAG